MDESASADTYDVAIVGFGPTGATLAGFLGRAGHRVVVIERERDVYSLPRAVHFDHEVARLFQDLGVADTIVPETCAFDACEFWTADREVLARFDTGFTTTDQGWASDYIFHQPFLEATLRGHAQAMASVDVRLGEDVSKVEADSTGARLFVTTAEGGSDTVHARFLVGCDGARSGVRAAAGLELEDLDFHEPWVVVDLVSRGELEGMPDILVQLCDPARPTTLVPGADGRYRFEFMLRPGETDEQMLRPEKLRELIGAFVDPESVDLVRAAVYRFHGLVARDWRRGCMLIAGDAAHQTPPFMGQGMCAGIRDAANLGWKLDLVLRGWTDDRLLDSYATERRPNVRRFIDQAIVMGRVICVQDEEAARQRNEQMLAARARGDAPPPAPTLPPLGPGFFQGPEGDPPHRLVGRLGPQPVVRATDFEGRMDDWTGGGFRLFLRDDRGAPSAEQGGRFFDIGGRTFVWTDTAPEREVARVVVDRAGDAAAWWDEQGIHAFLVRPDHAVFGVAGTPDDVAGLLDDLERALAGGRARDDREAQAAPRPTTAR